VSERLTLKGKLAAARDAEAAAAKRVERILNESKARLAGIVEPNAPPARSFSEEDEVHEENELYAEWAAISGIPRGETVTVSEAELERLQADVRAGEEAERKIAEQEEAERAAERLSDADADRLYESQWQWRL
jgi:hypothetical protein